jgi:hypothetical protein
VLDRELAEPERCRLGDIADARAAAGKLQAQRVDAPKTKRLSTSATRLQSRPSTRSV